MGPEYTKTSLVWCEINQKLILDRTDAESGGSDRASINACITVMSMPLYFYGPRVYENVIGLVWSNQMLILDRTDAELGGSDRGSINACITVMSMPLYSYGSRV